MKELWAVCVCVCVCVYMQKMELCYWLEQGYVSFVRGNEGIVGCVCVCVCVCLHAENGAMLLVGTRL